MPGPLSHVKVLDLSRIMAGPWCGQILADLGAEVIKVERAGAGDDTRTWGPPYLKGPDGKDTREAGYYLAVNRGKRSLTLNFENPEAQRIVRELAGRSDIVLENFKVGTLARFGLDAESLRRENPRLIYCSITGYGQTGPRRDVAAYDFVMQGMGGLMSVTGERDGAPGGGPQKVGIPIIDLTTGMYAVVAVLAALAARERTGRGDTIDLAMLDVAVATLCNQAMNFLTSGRVPRRNGNAHPNIQPQDVYACQDGAMVLAVGNDRQFVQLCAIIGQPQLADDERFRANGARVRHRTELTALLQGAFGTQPRRHWVAALEAAGVPCGPINTIDEVFADEQVQHRQMCLELDHPVSGKVPLVASPMKFAESTLEFRRHPPLLGEHTVEVLAELGRGPVEVERLRTEGVL